MSCQARRRGLTLVETMIGMLIAAIITGALLVFTLQSQKAEHRGQKVLDGLQSLQTLFHSLQDDLQALSIGAGEDPRTKIEVSDQDSDGFPELELERFHASGGGGFGVRYKVTYHVVPRDQTQISAGQVENRVRIENVLRQTVGHPDGDSEHRFAIGTLDRFQVTPLWVWESEESGIVSRTEASSDQPPADAKIVSLLVRIDTSAVQIEGDTKITSELPVSVHLVPREFNRFLIRHWIDQS